MTMLEPLLCRFDDLQPRTAEKWVAALLAGAEALHESDPHLLSLDPADLSVAERLQEEWHRWAEEAATLLNHVRPLLAAGRAVPGTDELRAELAQARLQAQMPPALVQERWRRAQTGRTTFHTPEEVRRELRLSVHG